MTDDVKPFEELQPLGDTPVAPAHAIASIALSLALKYHDINTVQEGALYQQYKLEGKNLPAFHLDMVFDTATKMEAWLLASSERIAAIVVDALSEPTEDEVADAVVEALEKKPDEPKQ